MATVLEGTWEEIKMHEAELTGRHVRLIVDADLRDNYSPDIQRKLAAWDEFVANGVTGVIVDDTREAVYADEVDRV